MTPPAHTSGKFLKTIRAAFLSTQLSSPTAKYHDAAGERRRESEDGGGREESEEAGPGDFGGPLWGSRHLRARLENPRAEGSTAE